MTDDVAATLTTRPGHAERDHEALADRETPGGSVLQQRG